MFFGAQLSAFPRRLERCILVLTVVVHHVVQPSQRLVEHLSFFPRQVEIVSGLGAEVGSFHQTFADCGNALFIELVELLCCHVLLAPPHLILSI